jgi:hypothetical protein
MTWKSKLDLDFEKSYLENEGLQSLYKFAMALILESKHPSTLPLTVFNPSKPNYCMINLQETHCLIYKIEEDSNKIEFLFCN